MKTCHYKHYHNTDTYGWVGRPTESCILTKYYNTDMGIKQLFKALEDEVITEQEYESIGMFDERRASKYDVEIIQNLAKKLNIKMVQK